jgi:hypothetical protein
LDNQGVLLEEAGDLLRFFYFWKYTINPYTDVEASQYLPTTKG